MNGIIQPNHGDRALWISNNLLVKGERLCAFYENPKSTKVAAHLQSMVDFEEWLEKLVTYHTKGETFSVPRIMHDRECNGFKFFNQARCESMGTAYGGSLVTGMPVGHTRSFGIDYDGEDQDMLVKVMALFPGMAFFIKAAENPRFHAHGRFDAPVDALDAKVWITGILRDAGLVPKNSSNAKDGGFDLFPRPSSREYKPFGLGLRWPMSDTKGYWPLENKWPSDIEEMPAHLVPHVRDDEKYSRGTRAARAIAKGAVLTIFPTSGSAVQIPSGSAGQTPSGSAGQTPSGSAGQTPSGSNGPWDQPCPQRTYKEIHAFRRLWIVNAEWAGTREDQSQCDFRVMLAMRRAGASTEALTRTPIMRYQEGLRKKKDMDYVERTVAAVMTADIEDTPAMLLDGDASRIDMLPGWLRCSRIWYTRALGMYAKGAYLILGYLQSFAGEQPQPGTRSNWFPASMTLLSTPKFRTFLGTKSTLKRSLGALVAAGLVEFRARENRPYMFRIHNPLQEDESRIEGLIRDWRDRTPRDRGTWDQAAKFNQEKG